MADIFCEKLLPKKNSEVISSSCLVAGPPNAATCEQVSRTVQHGAASRSGIGSSLWKTWSESRSLKWFPKIPCTYGNMGIFTSRFYKKICPQVGQNKNTVTSNHGYTMVDLKTSDTQSQKKSCGHGFGTCEKLHNFRHFTRPGLHELTVFCLTPRQSPHLPPSMCTYLFIYLSIRFLICLHVG